MIFANERVGADALVDWLIVIAGSVNHIELE
jgi:hypothetical protein